MKNNELKKFAQMLSEELKKPKEIQPTEIQVESTTIPVEISSIDMVSQYLSKKRVASETTIITETNNNIEEAITNPANIEKQRWADPLVPLDQKFVTVKDMNDHYTKFLARIQQQMSSIGGGGEVKFRGLDDVVTSTTGTNKFLTYNPSTKKFYFDFINPATESELGGIIPGPGFTVDVDGTLELNAGPSFYLDETGTFRLRPGSSDLIGGIKAGPGIAIDPDGTLFIDTEGLPFTFGNFTGLVGTYSSNTEYALLSSINEDEDIVIASNGTGDIKVVGGFEVYATNGSVTGSLEDRDPFFRILDDGQVRILVPLADTTEGGLEIIGSALGTSLAPGQAGTMLHLTGNADLPTRVYHDCLGDYNSYVFRRYNGSVITPTQVLANEDIGRFNWTAANDAGMPSQATAQIRVTALENQTTTAQGSKMVFTLTPAGSPTSSRVDVATISTADGVSATKFTGPLIGNADTATTATNLAAATGILAGSVSINPTSINKTSAATQTFTVSGLTTSHKIVITPGTALPYGLMIAAAWVSALNTLSIEFHNYGGNIDQGATTIQYFAWV